MSASVTLFDFPATRAVSSWYVVDDVVMGGRSNGNIRLTEEGYAAFEGYISLENSGGFSSVRHNLSTMNLENHSHFIIRLKGDGKRYQFRVKSGKEDYHSYISYFNTTGDWQIIRIPFRDMQPSYRGRTLDQPSYPGKTLSEVGFLIGNKKVEKFKLMIDTISIE